MKKSEAMKYLKNAMEILKKAGSKDGYYVNLKYIREAFGTLYLGILKAVDEVLLKSGMQEKKIPQDVNEYRKAIRKYIVKYGSKYSKMMDIFNDLYNEVHIAGYYRGLHRRKKIILDIFKEAENFIKILEGLSRKVGDVAQG